MCNDVNILARVQANMRRHDGQEDMATAAEIGDGNGLSFQIAERAYALGAHQLNATRVKTRND